MELPDIKLQKPKLLNYSKKPFENVLSFESTTLEKEQINETLFTTKDCQPFSTLNC